MPEWSESAVNVVVGALVLALLVTYRDRGLLKRVGLAKYQFRTWIRGGAK